MKKHVWFSRYFSTHTQFAQHKSTLLVALIMPLLSCLYVFISSFCCLVVMVHFFHFSCLVFMYYFLLFCGGFSCDSIFYGVFECLLFLALSWHCAFFFNFIKKSGNKGTASSLDTLWALIALKRQMQCNIFLALKISNKKEGWFTKYWI